MNDRLRSIRRALDAVRRQRPLPVASALDRAIGEEFARLAPDLDRCDAALSGDWGAAVHARGLDPLAAAQADDPPLPAGVDRAVMFAYLETWAEIQSRERRRRR